METGEKIRAIREAEGLNRRQFCEETGLKARTLEDWEMGKRTKISVTELQKITCHPRFAKYTLWLMNGTTAPEAGQISPIEEDTRSAGLAG